jgi:replicative DNA helicase
MFLNPSAAIEAAEVVDENDFFRHVHKQIFAAIGKIVARKMAVDVVTVRNELGQLGQLESVGGPSYISGLIDGVPRSVNWPHYAEIMRELRSRRELIAYAGKVLNASYAGDKPSADVRGCADEWLFELGGEAPQKELVSQSQAFHEFVDALEIRLQKKDELLGRGTGIPAIDDFTAGMVPHEMTVLAAATGGGKSALALNIAVAIAKMGWVVPYFSLEMSRQDLQFRLASTESGVPLFKIRKGWLTDNELSRVSVAMARISEIPLYIDETLELTGRELRARVRKASRLGQIGLVVLDYFQLVTRMSGDNKKADERFRSAQFAEISRSLKMLAREFGIPVLLLSQLSRGEKKHRRPELWDLKETSALEQDADAVWFLYHDNEKDGKTELIVAKARSGPTGTVELVFEKDILRFHDPKTQGPFLQPVQASLPA